MAVYGDILYIGWLAMVTQVIFTSSSMQSTIHTGNSYIYIIIKAQSMYFIIILLSVQVAGTRLGVFVEAAAALLLAHVVSFR